MTIDISNNDPRISYSVAQGVTQTSFTVPFEFFDDSDVNVYVDGTLKTITTDYTISGGGGSTGTVTISVTGASGGSVVVLTRDITIERTTDFTAGADINRAALNTQLDTLTAIAADVKDRAGLALSYNDRTVGVPTELPDVAGLKGKTLAFNASTGAPEAGPTIGEISNAGTFATNASNSATASANSASAAAGSASSASGSASAAASSASAASTSESNAATSASNASTSATNASNSASAASTSETNAASSASAASTSASNAATSETNAGNSATAAAGSATTASAAADAALAALDSFDDRYLGQKASDPTLDNDGDPLVAGALYFNTTDDVMKVYEGSIWVAAYASVSGALLAINNLSDVDDATSSRTNLGLGTIATQADSSVDINGGTIDGAVIGGTTAAAISGTTGAFSGDVTVPSINGGPLAGFRNAIINGNFDHWQRGTSFTGAAYGSDRWFHNISGTTATISRQAFALGQTDVPDEPQYFHRTVVSSVAGANNLSNLAQGVESVRTFAGQTVTLSFYAKADAAKNIAVEFSQRFGSGGSPSATVVGIGVTTLALTTSWQKFAVTVAIPAIAGKTLGTDGRDLLSAIIWFDAGSNFNARTNSLGQQSGTFDIAQVQLEAGSVATPFERRPVGTELALCQRYFEKLVFTVSTRAGAAGEDFYAAVNFPDMRVAPSIVKTAGTFVNSTDPGSPAVSNSSFSAFVRSVAAGVIFAAYTVLADSEL